MRIATWNVNAVNPRLPLITAWADHAAPDVLCLQETKCRAEDFPAEAFGELGYECAAHGDGRWNGVAILSRVGLADVRHDLEGQPAFEGSVEPRAIAATCAGVRVWSVYVPNGREVDHPHYAYKLAWLEALTRTVTEETATQAPGSRPLVLLGDFNVAPTDVDVWDINAFAGATHVTQAERDRLATLEAAGFTQVAPRPLKYAVAFTFWDYRQLAFPKNRGMRIDLAYINSPAAGLVTDAFVDREARKGKGTSDHAPIVIDLDREAASA